MQAIHTTLGFVLSKLLQARGTLQQFCSAPSLVKLIAKHKRLLMPFLSIFVLGGVLGWLFGSYQYSVVETGEYPEQLRSSEGKSDRGVVAVMEPPVYEWFDLVSRVESDTPVFLQEKTGAQKQAIEVLLAEAKLALNELAYTTPLERNAFALYRSVLLLDPGNEDAQLGVERIRLAYTILLEDAYEKGNQAKVRSYYHRAKGVGVDEPTLALYRGMFEASHSDSPRGISLVESSNVSQSRVNSLFQLRQIGKTYQSQKMYAHAIPVYQKLVKLSKTDSSDWLGLAVSLDSEGMAKPAVEAYKRVVRFKHSNPKVVDYSRQRIIELSGNF